MVNIRSLENDKANIIKNFKPVEMESYITSLVTILYEAFLEHDLDKCSSAKKLIEEATEIYEKEGYTNSLAMELKIRLAKANELLINTLEEKDSVYLEFSKGIVEEAYSNKIMKVIHNNNILESLIASYEKTPSEELASAIKEVVYLAESDLIGIKFLLEEKEFSENYIFSEEVEILKDYFSTFESLVEKINSF